VPRLGGAWTMLWRRKLNLTAKFEGGSSYYPFKRLVPGAFNMDFIGETCTALPCTSPSPRHPLNPRFGRCMAFYDKVRQTT
jgi:hypothetical protein